MWRGIASIILVIYLVIGTIASFGVGAYLEEYGDGGTGAFFLCEIIIFISATGLGLILDAVKYLERIAKNTECLRKGGTAGGMSAGTPTDPYDNTSMLSRALASDGIPNQSTVNPNPVPTPKIVAPPASWTCNKCLEENAAENLFCLNCGNKKSYLYVSGGEDVSVDSQVEYVDKLSDY